MTNRNILLITYSILELLCILISLAEKVNFWLNFGCTNFVLILPLVFIHLSYLFNERNNTNESNIDSNFSTKENFVRYLIKLQKIFAISVPIMIILGFISVILWEEGDWLYYMVPLVLLTFILFSFIEVSTLLWVYKKFFINNQLQNDGEKLKTGADIERKNPEVILDRLLSDCKQEGTLEDIENLKNCIEQNIKYNGSDKEFLQLNFILAKIYNKKASHLTQEYFQKVKNILPYIEYEDLKQFAQNSFEKNNFYDALFFYTYLIMNQKIIDIKELPDIYYKRAVVYSTLNKNELAIEDIKNAIKKTEKNPGTIEKLDMYNYKLAEEYTKLNNFVQAIKYYKEITIENNKYAEVQNKIEECQKAFEKQKEEALKTAANEQTNYNYSTAKHKKNTTKQPYLKNRKIELENCSFEDLLTLEGFDSKKAKKFISDRDNGKTYYDIDSFVEAFGLQPHQMIEIQDKIIFPHKPKNKMGRKIDW